MRQCTKRLKFLDNNTEQ